jgi:hypothetical protein
MQEKFKNLQLRKGKYIFLLKLEVLEERGVKPEKK